MMIHCEVCGLRDGDKMRIGDHTKLGEAINIRLPLHGSMIGSPNQLREIPAPFSTVSNWKDMHCPRCGKTPWTFMPGDLDKYNEQGGPDRVYTDDGWVTLPRLDKNDN